MKIDDDERKKMEEWPISGVLTEVIIGAAPKQKRINLYMAAGDNKTMFQINGEQAKYLIETLSSALDDITRGIQ